MRGQRRQRGLVVIAVMTMLLVFGLYVALGSLNFAAIRVANDRSINDALAQAKDALIAYAVSDANRPGELPCPDFDNDGQVTLADYAGSNCRTLVGRLPWRSLGLPDLRDAAGERLWYAVSDDFHASGTVALNSDTAFRATPAHTSLSIGGAQPASNLVAIVFAPGLVLRRAGAAASQDRSAAGLNTASNYLDSSGGVDNADGDTSFVSAASSEAFNDRLLPIYSDDVMLLVERRAAGEVASVMRQHYDAWEALKTTSGYTGFKGFYPWAAAITGATNPASSLPGTNGTTNGLVPFSTAPLTWSSASSLLLGCAGVGTTEITCTTFAFFSLLNINVSGRVGSIGTVPSLPPDATNVTVSGGVLFGAPTSSWTLVPASNALDYTYGASIFALGLVTVSVRAPTSIAMPTWLTDNGWQERLHYAVAPAYALTGNQTCGLCLTVNNAAAPANQKHSIVLVSGRALPLAAPAQPRPATLPMAMAEYFEGDNATVTDRIFNVGARTTAFNDQVVTVRP